MQRKYLWYCLNPLPPGDSETDKFILENCFSSVLPKYQKYHHSGNPKFNNLVIFQSLKLRNRMGKILSLKLNFTPNNLGYYGLSNLNFFF